MLFQIDHFLNELINATWIVSRDCLLKPVTFVKAESSEQMNTSAIYMLKRDLIDAFSFPMSLEEDRLIEATKVVSSRT